MADFYEVIERNVDTEGSRIVSKPLPRNEARKILGIFRENIRKGGRKGIYYIMRKTGRTWTRLLP